MTIPQPQQPAHEPPRAAVRPREAARMLGVSESKVAKMLAKGELRSVKLGWARLIPMDAIADVLRG